MLLLFLSSQNMIGLKFLQSIIHFLIGILFATLAIFAIFLYNLSFRVVCPYNRYYNNGTCETRPTYTASLPSSVSNHVRNASG